MYREFVINPKEIKKKNLTVFDEISVEFSKLYLDYNNLINEDMKNRAIRIHEKSVLSRNANRREKTLEDFIKEEYEYLERFKDSRAISISKVNGRMSNPLTNLPKEYRKHLRYGPDKEKLWSVDCVSFHPFLLASLFKPSENEEKLAFVEFILSNDLYNVIGDKAGIKDRDEAKKQTMISLFSNKYCQKTPVAMAFREINETLTANLDEFRNNGPKGHKEIAIKMQRLESDIMIQGALKDFYRLYPGRPAFPIHDSFLVLEEDVEIISKLIEAQCILKVGFAPKLKVEAPAR